MMHSNNIILKVIETINFFVRTFIIEFQLEISDEYKRLTLEKRQNLKLNKTSKIYLETKLEAQNWKQRTQEIQI